MSLVSTTAPWFVCHTRPRCEKKFAALMLAEGFEHYLPLVSSEIRYRHRIRAFSKPLFPGYVFARSSLDLKLRFYQQDLLVRAIDVDDEALFEKQLDDVRRIVASGLKLTLHPQLKRGTFVRVSGGPLYGLEGLVDDPTNPKGIVVSVNMLQQGLLVRLPLELLEPLS